MILNTYHKNSQNSYGAHSTASISAQFGMSEGITLQDVLDCCKQILEALRGRAFRREIPSRKEIMDKITQVQVETIDIRRDIKRIIGGQDGN